MKLKAFAIVKKKRSRISLLDLYDNNQIKGIKVERDEKIIRVEIKEIKNGTFRKTYKNSR